MARHVAEAVRSGQYRSPKTVLGFFAIALTVLGGTGSLGTLALSGSDYDFLIPILWVVVGLVFVGILVVVVIAMLTDPTRLMLGEMSGEEYLAYRLMTQGDSEHGEEIVGALPAGLRYPGSPLPAVGPKTPDQP